MPEPGYRVLAVASHPVQYMVPLLRRMAKHPQLDLVVAYCTLRGAEPAHDPGFDTTVQWDIPLLDGYSWQEMPNRGSGLDSFWGLRNPGLYELIRNGKFDAVLCYLSYRSASFWFCFFACRLSRTAFLFGTDASSLVSRERAWWKLALKKATWPVLFSLADEVIVPSTTTQQLMFSLRIPAERVTLTPYSVDNDWWMSRSQDVERDTIRANWGAGPETCVILFCAKLQHWKRPLDLLRAFARTRVRNAILVLAGEGPQHAELEKEASRLGVRDRVRFLGFLNQTELPPVYTAADLMVLPSEYEPFAVVVNEAYCCGCPVIASDHVGASKDLIAPVEPTLIYPCGDLDALAALLDRLCLDRKRLDQLRNLVRARIANWSPEDTVNATVRGIAAAVDHSRH